MIVFAFLAARLDHARIDIEHDYAPARFESESRGWATISGTEMPFVIVTRPEALRGIRLIGFSFVRSAKQIRGDRRLELSLIAQSRLVNAQP